MDELHLWRIMITNRPLHEAIWKQNQQSSTDSENPNWERSHEYCPLWMDAETEDSFGQRNTIVKYYSRVQ